MDFQTKACKFLFAPVRSHSQGLTRNSARVLVRGHIGGPGQEATDAMGHTVVQSVL